jgi:hypothetical protein
MNGDKQPQNRLWRDRLICRAIATAGVSINEMAALTDQQVANEWKWTWLSKTRWLND